MFDLQPSTWRLLGLGVAAGYAALGAFAILVPAQAAKGLLAIEPKKSAEADEAVSLVFPLLGARDVSIAAALFVLHHAKWDRAMGVLIVTGTILCAADTVAVGYRKGPGTCVPTPLPAPPPPARSTANDWVYTGRLCLPEERRSGLSSGWGSWRAEAASASRKGSHGVVCQGLVEGFLGLIPKAVLVRGGKGFIQHDNNHRTSMMEQIVRFSCHVRGTWTSHPDTSMDRTVPRPGRQPQTARRACRPRTTTAGSGCHGGGRMPRNQRQCIQGSA